MKKGRRGLFHVRPALVALGCLLLIEIVTAVYTLRSHRAIEALSLSAFRLEPETPRNIDDPPFTLNPSLHVLSVREILEQGAELPLRFAYDNPVWRRQAYKAYWHSSYGRWSYMPLRLHYAMHRIFAAYPTASVWYDFEHDLGIAEESHAFSLPDGDPFEHIVIVVMQTRVEKIMTLGNQIVIIGRPSYGGLQVLVLCTGDIAPVFPQEDILIQLVTRDGDEIDRTYIPYATETQSLGYADSLKAVWSRFFR